MLCWISPLGRHMGPAIMNRRRLMHRFTLPSYSLRLDDLERRLEVVYQLCQLIESVRIARERDRAGLSRLPECLLAQQNSG